MFGTPSKNPLRFQRKRLSPQPPKPAPVLPGQSSIAPPAQKPAFEYHWQASERLQGEVRLPTPVAPPVIVLGGKQTIIPQTSAAVRLATLYRIVLADEEEKWDAATATLLLEHIRRLPETPFKRQGAPTWKLTLAGKPITNDVEIIPGADPAVRHARFNKDAFARANPALQPKAEGNPDRVFYSNRLFRAVLRTFYNEVPLMEQVIRERYSYSVKPGEPVDEFQSFSLDELQFLASVLEDLPAGYRGIRGLTHFTRRKSGMTNPQKPHAPAIAWVTLGNVEFMDSAFTSGSSEYIQRLAAHEMSHFFWEKILVKDVRAHFMSFSGWKETAPDRWTHGTTTNFVSDYAATDPLEDFAETMAFYVYQPDKVRTVAPEKYRWAQSLGGGYEYAVLVDKKYTWQVFNLEPKTTFPGKITGIDVETWKTVAGDNRVIATLHLSPAFGGGAERAYARIASTKNTYTDQYFSPVDGNKYLLRADFTLSKYAASGYWVPELITVSDKADNRRYEGQKQFGWLLMIDNPDEDTEAPVADTERIGFTTAKSGNDTVVRVTVPVTDRTTEGLTGYATLAQEASRQSETVYATYDAIQRALVYAFTIRGYRASGTWEFREFVTQDIAGNRRRYDLKEKTLTVQLTGATADTTRPELDQGSIRIEAVPTNPKAPNGETNVTIWYKAKDDISGLGLVSYSILKPTGDSLFDYHYHENFHTPVFVGDPAAWKLYEIKLTLPPGSPPGTWVLREMTLKDKAGNTLSANFVEIGILKEFTVEGRK